MKNKTNITLFFEEKDCCGCSGCLNVCPRNAISMKVSKEGFLYPIIDNEKCIHCQMCKKICAFQNGYIKDDHFDNSLIYGVKHKSKDVILSSRSGGIFTALTDKILENDGIIYGCTLDKTFLAIHKRATNKKQRNEFRKSKYIQSDLKQVFSEIKEELNNGKLVLFSGTTCQCVALEKYINYFHLNQNLLTVDIICHGVPSPKVWHDYVSFVERTNGKKIISVDFRNKEKFGWKDHVGTFTFDDGSTLDSNIFKKLYFSHNIVRDSCFECPYRNIHHMTDITIGDFWGIEKTKMFNDNKGISLVIINSNKGKKLFDSIKENIDFIESSEKECMQPALVKNYQIPKNREKFWNEYNKNDFYYITKKYTKISLIKRIKRKMKNLVINQKNKERNL